jgi:hypothetical protein
MPGALPLGLLFIAIGLVPGSFGVYSFVRNWRFLRTAIRASGTVTEMRERPGSEGGTTYTPIVTFTAQSGEAIHFTSRVSSNQPRFHVGQEVPVVYDPHHPQHASMPSFIVFWFAALLFGGFGLLFIMAGLFVVLISK